MKLMQILLPSNLLTTFALIATFAVPAIAGGPVIVEEAYEAPAAPRLTPGEKIAIAAGLILVIGLVAGGGSGGPAACACNGDEPPDGGGSCAC